MRKKAIIDIDNTLWHFCGALYERLKEINSDMPSPDHWKDWDMWLDYCSKEDFSKAIHSIHLKQDDCRYLPYPEAKDFLATLKERNMYIIVASHRSNESFEQTFQWLKKHDLIFDELHVSSDKTVLFDATCHIVVDDSPHTLEKAVKNRLLAAGLRFPWNRAYENNGVKLFNNLYEILQYILKKTALISNQ